MLSIFGVCPITFLKTFFEIVEGGLRVNFKVINDFIALLELLEDVRTIHKISYCFIYCHNWLPASVSSSIIFWIFDEVAQILHRKLEVLGDLVPGGGEGVVVHVIDDVVDPAVLKLVLAGPKQMSWL